MNSIRSKADGHADSLWEATATPAPACPPVTAGFATDVLVVGAGFTGLSAALHLAEMDRQVVVLDSHAPGWGCSGRNGGQVNPAWKLLPSELEKRFGADAARRASTLADGAADLVFELVARHGIECEAIRPGYIQGAVGARGSRFIASWISEWRDAGVDVRLLERDEIKTLTGTSEYDCGMLDSRGGSVQPLSYARGLARAAVAAGAVVHGSSPVQAVERRGNEWVCTTPGGVVKARHLLWCTNGYTDKVFPGLREASVSVSSFIVASTPMTQAQREHVVPGRHAVSETKHIQVYYRVDEAGRLVFGGRGNTFNTGLHGSTQALERQAMSMFPALEGIEWEYRWGGHPAMTRDRLPRLADLGNGAFAAFGYNGRGVAMATMFGRELARAVAGGDMLMPVSSADRFVMHRFRQLGISWHLLAGRIQDRLRL